MTKEDELFVINKFKRAMAGYLKANGADASVFSATDDASKELVEQARNYAVNQAQIAAFHQDGAFGETAADFARGVTAWRNSNNKLKKALGLAADVTIPFKKTPANVLESALAYSPLELAKVAKETPKLLKGTLSATEYIDDIAKGLTGTAGLAIGAILAREGIISIDTRMSDKREAFDKQTGRQNVALKVGDTYIGLDQLIPAAAPLIYGATVYDAMNGGDDDAFAAMITGITALANGVTEMTMLSGIADTLSSVRYADSESDIWGSLGAQLASNLSSQLLPTLGRKTETTIDKTRRSTYSDKAGLKKKADQELKYLQTKVPGLQAAGEKIAGSQGWQNTQEKLQGSDGWLAQKAGGAMETTGNILALQPDIDVKGQVRQNTGGDNALLRGVNNFLNPLTVSKDKSTDLDNERRRVADATGSDKVMPYIASSESKIDDRKLTPEEWTEYRQYRGQMREALADAWFKDDRYADTSDADKAAIYEKIDGFTKAAAQSRYGKEMSSEYQGYMDIYEQDGVQAAVDAIANKSMAKAIADEAGVTTSSKVGKEIQAAVASGDMEAAQSYGDAAKQLPELGLEKPGPAYTYIHAQEVIPGLTTEQFADTYKEIDTNGNQGLTQDEIVDYLNKNHVSQSDGMKIWNAYGNSDWKKVPALEGGTWKKKKAG